MQIIIHQFYHNHPRFLNPNIIITVNNCLSILTVSVICTGVTTVKVIQQAVALVGLLTVMVCIVNLDFHWCRFLDLDDWFKLTIRQIKSVVIIVYSVVFAMRL